MTPLDLLLIQAYTGGVNMPAGVTDALKLARANAAGTNIEYITAATAVAGDNTLATALAPHLRGRGLTVDSSGNLAVRARPRALQLQEYFIDPGTTGRIGQLGWALINSATILRSGNTNFFQAVRFGLVSPTAGFGGLALGQGTNGIIGNNPFISRIQAGIAIPSAPPATWHVGFGLSDDHDGDFAAIADGVGIYATNATANWQCIVRTGSTGAPVDSGVPVSTSLSLMTIHQAVTSPARWLFYVGNTNVADITSTPAGNVTPCFVSGTATAASTVTFPIGYFGWAADLGGYFDDDAFLEV